MSIPFRLCAKDLRHLWPYAAFMVFLIALRALLDVLLPVHPGLRDLHGILSRTDMTIAYVVITVLLIQSDALTGDTQFWLTRPVTWRNLAAGKILFLLCVINIPVLVAQSAAMLANGISPLDQVSVLGLGQLSIIATLGVAALIASITRNVAQFAVAFLALVALQLVLFILGQNRIYFVGNVTGSGNMLDWFLMAFFAPVPLALLWLQYSRRATASVMGLMFAVLLLISTVPVSGIFWHVTSLWRARMAGTFRSASPVTIHLSATPFRRPDAGADWAGGDTALLCFPVRISGIPKDSQLMGERLRFRVAVPGNSSWDSGWVGGYVQYPTNLLGRNIKVAKFMAVGTAGVIDADREYSACASVPWDFYTRAKDIPAQIRGSLASRLLGPPVQVDLYRDRLVSVLNGTGRCGVFRRQDSYQPGCFFTKLPSAELKWGPYSFSLEDIGSSTVWRYTTSGMYLYDGTATHPPDILSIRREEAWFETNFSISNVRMSDYLFRRVKR